VRQATSYTGHSHELRYWCGWLHGFDLLLDQQLCVEKAVILQLLQPLKVAHVLAAHMQLRELAAPTGSANHSIKAIWFEIKEDELKGNLLGLQKIDGAPLVRLHLSGGRGR
jgi:hypothetical protein